MNFKLIYGIFELTLGKSLSIIAILYISGVNIAIKYGESSA